MKVPLLMYGEYFYVRTEGIRLNAFSDDIQQAKMYSLRKKYNCYKFL